MSSDPPSSTYPKRALRRSNGSNVVDRACSLLFSLRATHSTMGSPDRVVGRQGAVRTSTTFSMSHAAAHFPLSPIVPVASKPLQFERSQRVNSTDQIHTGYSQRSRLHSHTHGLAKIGCLQFTTSHMHCASLVRYFTIFYRIYIVFNTGGMAFHLVNPLTYHTLAGSRLNLVDCLGPR